MRGSLVERLQLNLQRLGFYPGKVDGIFGAQTLESVKAVQAQFNLEVDGIVGAKTWLVILQ
ncbi:MAG: peptidoglycan-binding protein [Cyanobacteria bacterium REEB444]|nr:peptidoglycan-binding protein [Cyanobacteria bacterium REEB444]